jgi:hypothetical protein
MIKSAFLIIAFLVGGPSFAFAAGRGAGAAAGGAAGTAGAAHSAGRAHGGIRLANPA